MNSKYCETCNTSFTSQDPTQTNCYLCETSLEALQSLPRPLESLTGLDSNLTFVRPWKSPLNDEYALAHGFSQSFNFIPPPGRWKSLNRPRGYYIYPIRTCEHCKKPKRFVHQTIYCNDCRKLPFYKQIVRSKEHVRNKKRNKHKRTNLWKAGWRPSSARKKARKTSLKLKKSSKTLV
jgi:hypothetical protein